MAYASPETLRADHDLEGFDCGNPTLNDWLVRHALQAQGSGSARTFVVTDEARVAGYFSLSTGQVESTAATDRVRHGMGRYPIPVVVLTRLAVAQADQGQGVGVGMLQDAIARTVVVAEQAGVRALLVHPIDDAADQFYRRFGFETSPIRERQLLLLLKDARKLLARR